MRTWTSPALLLALLLASPFAAATPSVKTLAQEGTLVENAQALVDAAIHCAISLVADLHVAPPPFDDLYHTLMDCAYSF